MKILKNNNCGSIFSPPERNIKGKSHVEIRSLYCSLDVVQCWGKEEAKVQSVSFLHVFGSIGSNKGVQGEASQGLLSPTFYRAGR